MHKDYYKILGVTEFNTPDEIKTAYRKLARQYHPDIVGNSTDMLTRFKEINEAYQVLSSKIKKDEYDKARAFYKYAQNGSQKEEKTQANTSEEKKVNNKFQFNWSDIVSPKHRNSDIPKNSKKNSVNGEDIHTDLDINIYESLVGCTKTINMLQTTTCPKCRGRKFTNGAVCSECNNKGYKNYYKKFTVKIPAEIKDNSKIRLAGEGQQGQNGGKNGDLYITIHIIDSQSYKTEGLNILKTIPITPYEAVLGTTISLSGLNGKINFKIQPNTQNGQKIRLSKCGLVQNNKVGDMIVTVEIRIPKNLSSEEIELYKKLESISSSNIRDTFYDR